MPRPLSAALCHTAAPCCAVLSCATPCPSVPCWTAPCRAMLSRAAPHCAAFVIFSQQRTRGSRRIAAGTALSPQPTPSHGLTVPGIRSPHPHPATLRPWLRAPTTLVGRGWMRCGHPSTEGSTCPCPPPPPAPTHRPRVVTTASRGRLRIRGCRPHFLRGGSLERSTASPEQLPQPRREDRSAHPPVSRVRAPRDPTATEGGERSAAPGLWAQLRGAAVPCGAVRCRAVLCGAVGSPGVGSSVRAGLGSVLGSALGSAEGSFKGMMWELARWNKIP